MKEDYIQDKAEQRIDFKKLHSIVRGINKTTLGKKATHNFDTVQLPNLEQNRFS